MTRRLGPVGIVGAVLIAFAAAAAFVVQGPMRAELSRARTRADAAERAAIQQPVQAPPMSAAEHLIDFESRFVDDREIPAMYGRLLDLARAQRLRIDQAEFKLTSEAAQPLQRYAMQLPVRGEYRALRRFVGNALRDQPGLAMEEISLRRSDPRLAMLDAQIRFVLFVRKPSPAAIVSTVPAVLSLPAPRSVLEQPLALR